LVLPDRDSHIGAGRPRRWILLVGRETWWQGGKSDAFRNGHWVHLSRGARADVLKWFQERERELA
jgi:hypothetical protein